MTDRLSAEQRAELARLEEAATPGKWRACPVNREKMGVCPCVSVFQEEGGIVLSASLDGWGDPEMNFDKTTMEYRKEMAANLDLVAAFRNAAPALLAAAEEAERLRERVAAANERARVLAEEVNAWRWWGTHELSEDMSNEATAVFDARDATDAACALEGE